MPVNRVVLFHVFLILSTMLIAVTIGCQSSSLTSAPAASVLYPTTPEAPITAKEYYSRGIELKDKQQLDQAFSAFSSVVKLDPDYTEAYYELGKVAFYQADWDKTIMNCSKAISLNPVYLEAYYIRGLARMKKSLYNDAIADLNVAIGMEVSKKEMSELKKVTNLFIPPGELILLHLQFIVSDGKDCRGNSIPYVNSIQIEVFANPGDSCIEIDRIYLDPPVEGISEIRSPIRYADQIGLHYLSTCFSSTSLISSAPACRIDYKPKGTLVYKNSNEISKAEIVVEPSELVCPTN